MILRVLLAGWVILLVAGSLNFFATRTGIVTWYPFLAKVKREGAMRAFGRLSVLSLVFLFLLYPGTLGFAVYFTLTNFK